MNNLPPKNRAFFLADIITQSVLIGFTIIALLGSINTGSAIFIVLLMLIPIGIYQMLSAAIHLFNGKQIPKIRRLRNVHFWGGLMYLAMIFFSISSPFALSRTFFPRSFFLSFEQKMGMRG